MIVSSVIIGEKNEYVIYSILVVPIAFQNILLHFCLIAYGEFYELFVKL